MEFGCFKKKGGTFRVMRLVLWEQVGIGDVKGPN